MTRRSSLGPCYAVLAAVLFLSVVPTNAAADAVTTARFQPNPIEGSSTTAPEHEQQQRKKWKKAWIAAWVAFGVVSFLDIHSSAGKSELNPLLRGQNGYLDVRKAALIKAAGGAAFFGAQWWIARKHPEQNFYKPFTFATAGVSVPVGITAVRNYGVRAPVEATQVPAYLLREP